MPVQPTKPAVAAPAAPVAAPKPTGEAAVAAVDLEGAPPAVQVSKQSAGLWKQSHQVAPAQESTADRRAAALAILNEGATEGGEGSGEGAEPAPSAAVKPAAAAAEAGEAPPAAGAKEETPAAPADPIAKRFEDLVKVQNEVRKERELLAREREGKPAAKPKSALEALKLGGYTYEEAVDEILGTSGGAKKPAPAAELPPALQKKLEEMDTELKGYREERAQAKAAAEEADDRRTIGEAIKAGGEKYELLAELGDEAVGEVYARAVKTYKDTGEWVGGSPQAALELAMQVTLERHEKRATGLLQSNWAKRKVGSAGPKPDVVRPKEPPGQKPSASRTLHNGQVAASPPRAASAHPSKDELRREALQVLNEGIRGESASS